MRKRMILCGVLAGAFFITLIARIGYIALSKAYTVGESQHSYTLVLDTVEPNLYYSDYQKLTNNVKVNYALLKPTAKTMAALSLNFDDAEAIAVELRAGKPILKKTEKSQIHNIEIVSGYETENTCSQLLSRQSGGLLSFLPLSVGKRKMNFSVDATGRLLAGDEGRIQDENYITSEGLLLTLDEEVQRIAYNAAAKIENGCVVVMDVKTTSLLACVTKPDDTYINKALRNYSVGSIYKLVIAACALENGIEPEFECKGSVTIGNTTYRCQKERKHGKMNLENALAYSCNCYFVQLAEKLGAERILETSYSLGFGEAITLYKNWQVNGSVLPTKQQLLQEGELPLIGFGQGKLMSTPIQFCKTLCVIANGGMAAPVRLVQSEIAQNGEKTNLNYPEPERVLSARSAYLLLQYMRSVVAKGTANAADYNQLSAGKTATAQTGQYENGKEKLNTWFAGVYPCDKPQYAIVVLCENGTSGAENCCPVFRTIVENLF